MEMNEWTNGSLSSHLAVIAAIWPRLGELVGRLHE